MGEGWEFGGELGLDGLGIRFWLREEFGCDHADHRTLGSSTDGVWGVRCGCGSAGVRWCRQQDAEGADGGHHRRVGPQDPVPEVGEGEPPRGVGGSERGG